MKRLFASNTHIFLLDSKRILQAIKYTVSTTVRTPDGLDISSVSFEPSIYLDIPGKIE